MHFNCLFLRCLSESSKHDVDGNVYTCELLSLLEPDVGWDRSIVRNQWSVKSVKVHISVFGINILREENTRVCSGKIHVY